MKDYSKDVTFLPVTKNVKEIACIQDVSPHTKGNEFLRYTLPKGRYDINYSIQLLSIILEKCEQEKMSPRDLQFSLCHSIKKLLAMLEVERNDMILKFMQDRAEASSICEE